MFKVSFSDGLAIAGIVLAIVLVVLDKAGKLKGPMLLIMLAVAAAMTLPLALGNSWVGDVPSGILKVTRGMLMFFVLGLIYSAIAVWISTGNAEELAEGKGAATRPVWVIYARGRREQYLTRSSSLS